MVEAAYYMYSAFKWQPGNLWCHLHGADPRREAERERLRAPRPHGWPLLSFSFIPFCHCSPWPPPPMPSPTHQLDLEWQAELSINYHGRNPCPGLHAGVWGAGLGAGAFVVLEF